MNEITFTNTWDEDISYIPKPAMRNIPNWYQDTPGNVDFNNLFDKVTDFPTVKKCIPFLDAIGLGYLILSSADLVITLKHDTLHYEWNCKNNLIEFHDRHQIDKYPVLQKDMLQVPKWMNPWSIRTPKGYSCLFVNPLHREDLPFKILEGVVDTDKYVAPVNFPFILKDSTKECYIPAGTPIAQVFPFKRESWKMSMGSSDDLKSAVRDQWLVRRKEVKLNYKPRYWQRKEFR